MSDTKALQDVVAKALANWGNGKAQDAFEALMGRLKASESMSECRSGKIGRLEEEVKTQFAMRQNSSEMCNALKAELDAEHARTQRAEADNAALLTWVNANAHRIGDRLCPYTGGYACEPGCMAHGIHTQPHPGAALLEELEGLRKQVEFLSEREKHIAKVLDVADGGQYRNDWDGAVSRLKATAHNAALEEAAQKAGDLTAKFDADRGAIDANTGRRCILVVNGIRALKTGQGE